MYKIGDLIIYSNTGVCKLKDIIKPNFDNISKDELYYVLKPLYQDGTIYTPVNNTKIFMRPIISEEEAEQLIDMIPSIQAEAYHNHSIQQLSEHYQLMMKSHNCEDLIELIMSIYNKKQYLSGQKRKFGQVDQTFMKRAEELLYGEFSVALNIPKEEVQEYIASKVENKK